MLIVDGQIHLWEKGTLSPQHRQAPYSAEQAIAAMDQAGVDRALIHPVLWNPDSNELAQEAVCKYPNRFTIMGWFHLDDPNGRDLIARWKERPSMFGLRFYFNERHKREVAVRRSSLPDTAMRWTRLVPPRQAFNRPGPSRHTPHPRARGEAEARPLRMAGVEILPERRPTVSLVLDSSARSRGPTRRKPLMRCAKYLRVSRKMARTYPHFGVSKSPTA